MKFLTNVQIIGRRDTKLQLNITNGYWNGEKNPKTKIVSLNGITLGLEAATKHPTARKVEQRRILDKAMDKLEPANDNYKKVPFVGLEDDRYDLIMVGIREIIPKHPVLAPHTQKILNFLESEDERIQAFSDKEKNEGM